MNEIFSLLQKKWNDIKVLPPKMLWPAPRHVPPLYSAVIVWFLWEPTGCPYWVVLPYCLGDISNKDLNIQDTCLTFREPPSHWACLTSSIVSPAADFLAAQFEPFWVGLPWMNSCLKADVKWVLLHVRAIGWTEHSPEQQRWPHKAGRLSWGWFCRCASV